MKIAPAIAAWLCIAPAAAADTPFKDTQDATVARGAAVFNTYCVLCHGVRADGTGRAARMYTPPPANLVASDKNRAYKELIVRSGGEALGRSKFMPPWNDELSAEQILDLMNYLEAIQTRS